MEGEVVPSVAWRTKVSQRKAPGAMSAIALLVSPVRPRVDFIWGAFCSAMSILLESEVRLADRGGIAAGHSLQVGSSRMFGAR
jgi:hypothetical protein